MVQCTQSHRVQVHQKLTHTHTLNTDRGVRENKKGRAKVCYILQSIHLWGAMGVWTLVFHSCKPNPHIPLTRKSKCLPLNTQLKRFRLDILNKDHNVKNRKRIDVWMKLLNNDEQLWQSSWLSLQIQERRGNILFMAHTYTHTNTTPRSNQPLSIMDMRCRGLPEKEYMLNLWLYTETAFPRQLGVLVF